MPDHHYRHRNSNEMNMSLTVNRVSLFFNWPLNVQWGGYVNPYFSQAAQCQKCGGTGRSTYWNELSHRWHGHCSFLPKTTSSRLISEDDPDILAHAKAIVSRGLAEHGLEADDPMALGEARRLVRRWNSQWRCHLSELDVEALRQGGALKELGTDLSPARVSKFNYLSNDADQDANWARICIAAQCHHAGAPVHCDLCQEGLIWPNDHIKSAAEHWQPSEPPEGQAYQIWSMSSKLECPISPVFGTPEELSRWLAFHNVPIPGQSDTSASAWLDFIVASQAPQSAQEQATPPQDAKAPQTKTPARSAHMAAALNKVKKQSKAKSAARAKS